ncbi:tyrosine-type recombinase/integrase [Algibacter mikhailovii]|uniref:Integrase n=1 Tax=Algibacter mikhailovii TaxID=425498 RepID=A0A918VF77_9FLAO|nr:site-specific integrase [Algibacter mikhailovii]GGZ92174.1 hypothetical protein GCM10007028_33310 [Algibacter mikhailovii]
MSNLSKIIRFEHRSEHVLEHALKIKRQYSAPKIYTAKGDLRKRWYVYFSYRHPESGKLERLPNIYGDVNTYKTKEERLYVLSKYQKKLSELLEEGFNPYQDNAERLANRQSKAKVENTKPSVTPKQKEDSKSEDTQESNDNTKKSIREAFEFGISIKAQLLSKTTMRAYENRIHAFLDWIDKSTNLKTIDQLDEKEVSKFLNAILQRTSARTRNNYRVDLSSLFQVLVDNYIIVQNCIKKIPVLKTIPQRNKTYSTEEQGDIFKYLEENDAVLLLYIKFISYNFLRPIEVCRLRVRDIDLKNKTLCFKAKSGVVKTKIIPDLLLKELEQIKDIDKTKFLFTPEGVGGDWSIEEGNKRDYFTKRFKRVVKDHFKLGIDYGLYSFRHTFITKLYRALVKTSSPFEAKSKLMLITGHATMAALEKYLRDIDAELPEDYSALLT